VARAPSAAGRSPRSAVTNRRRPVVTGQPVASRPTNEAADVHVAWSGAQVYASRAIAQAASLLTTVLLARALDPTAVGLYSFAVILAMLLADVSGAGLDLAAVRFAARDASTDPARARGVLVLAGLMKGGCALALSLVVLALAHPLAGAWLGRPELVGPIRFGAVAGVGIAMTEYAFSALQARERFGHVVLVNVVVAVSRVAPVAALMALDALSLETALLAVAAAAYVGCTTGTAVAWHVWRGSFGWGSGIARELLGVARWLAVAPVITALWNSVDVVALTQAAGPAATGIYTSARMLALPLLLAGSATGAVLLPRWSRMAAREPIGPALRQVGLRVGGLAALLAAASAAAAPVLVPLVYGARYVDVVPVFQILAIAYCVQIGAWPALSALLVLDQAGFVVKSSFAGLCLCAVGYILMVPSYEGVGAALVLVVGSAFIVASAWWRVRAACREAGGGKT
jgi:O-antigen/teichoic acid export membrane protein